MKVVAFNGSPRKNGNTIQSIKIVLDELKKEEIETEIVQLGGRKVFGCLGCMKCFERKDKKCIRKDDEMNEIIEKVLEADGIIVGSPTYCSNVTSEVKAFIDRCGLVSKANGGLLANKVGAPVVVARRAGSNFTYSAINFFFGAAEMIVPASSYWNMALARNPGEVLNDEEGVRTFQTLGKNMANLMKKLYA